MMDKNMWNNILNFVTALGTITGLYKLYQIYCENRQALIDGYAVGNKYYIVNKGKAIAYNVQIEIPVDCKDSFLENKKLPLDLVNPGDEIDVYILGIHKDSNTDFSVKFVWDDKSGKDRSRKKIFSC